MAMALRAALLRMKLALRYNGSFDIVHESIEVYHRNNFMEQWIDLSIYNRDGFTREEIDELEVA